MRVHRDFASNPRLALLCLPADLTIPRLHYSFLVSAYLTITSQPKIVSENPRTTEHFSHSSFRHVLDIVIVKEDLAPPWIPTTMFSMVQARNIRTTYQLLQFTLVSYESFSRTKCLTCARYRTMPLVSVVFQQKKRVYILG